MKRLPAIITLVLSLCSSLATAAPAATLTIDGNIALTNVAGKRQFEFRDGDLKALKQTAIVTSTNWTTKKTFRGPLLSEILSKVGAKGATLDVCAVDDYCYNVPVSDAAKYGVILALSSDGKDLPRDRFGPIWIIYPRDDYPGVLNSATYDARFIWQVTRITVK
jgi:hypothetical protein